MQLAYFMLGSHYADGGTPWWHLPLLFPALIWGPPPADALPLPPLLPPAGPLGVPPGLRKPDLRIAVLRRGA